MKMIYDIEIEIDTPSIVAALNEIADPNKRAESAISMVNAAAAVLRAVVPGDLCAADRMMVASWLLEIVSRFNNYQTGAHDA
jgi:hypothetical protein